MLDIESLEFLTVNCNTMDIQTQNEQMYGKTEDEQQHTNNTQEAGKPEVSNVNTTGIPKSNSKDSPTVIDNNNSKINYFIPDLQEEAEKRSIAEINTKLHKEF